MVASVMQEDIDNGSVNSAWWGAINFARRDEQWRVLGGFMGIWPNAVIPRPEDVVYPDLSPGDVHAEHIDGAQLWDTIHKGQRAFALQFADHIIEPKLVRSVQSLGLR